MAFERPFLKLWMVLDTLACTHCLVPSPFVARNFLHDHCLWKSISAIKTKVPGSQKLFSPPGRSILSSHACCTDWEQLIPSALSLSISPRSSTVSEIPSLHAAFWLAWLFFFLQKLLVGGEHTMEYWTWKGPEDASDDFSILQARKWRSREKRWLAQTHTAY